MFSPLGSYVSKVNENQESKSVLLFLSLNPSPVSLSPPSPSLSLLLFFSLIRKERELTRLTHAFLTERNASDRRAQQRLCALERWSDASSKTKLAAVHTHAGVYNQNEKAVKVKYKLLQKDGGHSIFKDRPAYASRHTTSSVRSQVTRFVFLRLLRCPFLRQERERERGRERRNIYFVHSFVKFHDH